MSGSPSAPGPGPRFGALDGVFGALSALAGALSLAPGLPPLVRLLLAGPLLYAAPGQPIAALLGVPDRLGRALAGVWLSLGLLWFEVGLLRELGRSGPDQAHGALIACSALLWGLGALVVALRRPPAAGASGPGARLGLIGALLGVLWTAADRAADWSRPLEDHWHLEGAELLGQGAPAALPGPEDEAEAPTATPPITLRLEGPGALQAHGWEGAGAYSLALFTDGDREDDVQQVTFIVPEGTVGAVALAVQGPEGAALVAEGPGAPAQRGQIERAPTVHADEGPVARYRERGVVGLRLPLTAPDGGLVRAEIRRPPGDRGPLTLFVLTGPEAVWSLHAAGRLRFVHYYQLLNQVENLNWAAEVLDDRRLVWNQPPGWTPLLAAAGAVAGHDMSTAGLLFLGVLLLVGAQAVAAVVAAAPDASPPALLLPGGLVAAHGLLMIEPGSHNFPDSLYAAAVVGVAAALLRGEPRAWALLALGAQALRWPGLTVALLLAGGLALRDRAGLRAAAARLRPGLVFAALGLAGMTILTLIATMTGDADDLLFILYFETFPEHWHGETAPLTLLGRVPHFAGLLSAYTGGGVVLLLALCLFGPPSAPKRAAQGLGLGALAYASLLATIDHHPTHYFLPLVALCGPALAAASAGRGRLIGWGAPLLCLAGLAALILRGQV